MNLLIRARRLGQTARRPRSTGLAVESIEKRLAPAPILPLPPPVVATHGAVVEPPDPCARQATVYTPPDPC
jgi:hypothetical protein